MEDFRQLLLGFPRKTGQETPEGRPHWYNPLPDQALPGQVQQPRGHYSEYSGTDPYMGGWITSPTVDAYGVSGPSQGRIDPITGEIMPAFQTQDEAERYARMRSRMR